VGLRRIRDEATHRTFGETLESGVTSIFKVWLLGVAAQTVKLTPTNINAFGLQLHIENSDSIVGLLFIYCIILYVFGIYLMVVWSLFGVVTDRTKLRNLLWTVYGNGKSARGVSFRQVYITKKVTRDVLRVFHISGIVLIAIPLIHILLFERSSVLAALRLLVA
jgi:hypothetical protein